MFGSSSAISHVHLVELWSSGEADRCWLAVADFCFSENEEKKGEQKEAAASQHAAKERGCYRHMLFSTQNTEDFPSVENKKIFGKDWNVVVHQGWNLASLRLAWPLPPVGSIKLSPTCCHRRYKCSILHGVLFPSHQQGGFFWGGRGFVY